MAGHRKALIVAVEEYEHPGLRRLRSPAADAEALATALGDPRIGEFDVSVVRNEPAYEIQSRLEDLFADAKGDDVLLVHFSGHGLKGEAGDLYFAARNTRPNRLASTAVPADFVQRCVRSSPSRSIVLLLDCCYGGAFSQGVSVRAAGDVPVLDSFPAGKLGGGRGRAVITASTAMEYAFEGEQLTPDSHAAPSLFTSALVQGLTTGEADLDEDGLISLNELYDYVFDRVQAQNPNQTPSRDIEMQGELYLAKSGRRRVRPAPVPPDLQAATEDPNPYARLGAVAELRARLLSENLPVAAGALDALRAMASTDTRLVAEAAAAAVTELGLHVRPTSLEFGSAPVGASTGPLRLEISGAPLTRALTVQASQPWIRWDEVPGGYRVWARPSRPGRLTGTITLNGPIQNVEVPITVEGQTVGPSTVSPGLPVDPVAEEQSLGESVARSQSPTAPSIDTSTNRTTLSDSSQTEETKPPPALDENAALASASSPPAQEGRPSAENRQSVASPTERGEKVAQSPPTHGPSPTARPDDIGRRANVGFVVACVLAGVLALPTLPSLIQDQDAYISVSGLCVVIGAALAITRRFRSLGSGLALAGAVTASWWFVLLIGLTNVLSDSPNVDTWNVQLVFNVLVVLSGVVLYRYGRRLGVLRLGGIRWQQGWTRLFGIVAVVGALGLVVHAIQLIAAVGGQYAGWVVAFTVWLAALTVCLPVLAVNAAPKQFRNGLLLAWLLSGCDLFVVALRLEQVPANINIVNIGLSIFALSLLIQLVAAVRIWRQPASEDPSWS